MRDFDSSKGTQDFIVLSEATFDLLCADNNPDLPSRSRQMVRVKEYGQYHNLGDLNIQVALYSAGHMPGSVISSVIYKNGKHFVYTSDFDWPIHPLPSQPDVLVVDATYGDPQYVRSYSRYDATRKLLEIIHREIKYNSIAVTGYKGRLQWFIQLVSDLYSGPILVSTTVCRTLPVYMKHLGFDVEAVDMLSQEGRKIIGQGKYLAIIDPVDKTENLLIEPDKRITLSQFAVPLEEPIRELDDGRIRVAITDHADFTGTIKLIEAIQPKFVIVDGSKYGNASSLSAYVENELNIPSHSNQVPNQHIWGLH